MFKVNVSPDMGMYHLLRSQGYDPAYAAAEFIDNALHAYMAQRPAADLNSPLEVNIRFYSVAHSDPEKRNSLVIDDNGPGIKKTQLADAMKPAKPSKVKGLSEFGIGMKAAAVWFCDKWILKTKPKGGLSRYELTFDLPKLLESGTSAVEVKEKKSSDSSGTVITLSQLRRSIDRARFVQICDDLREIYQRFTSGSSPKMVLMAYFDETPISLKYQLPDRPVLVASVFKQVDKKTYAIGSARAWHVPIGMTFQGVSVSGFICLLERGSYVDNPGLVMFRDDRVISGTTRRPNLPSALFRTSNKYSRQRVYGQLFVDGLPVTYTKDGFEIDMDDFVNQLHSVDGVAELLRQAEVYRSVSEAIAVKKESDIPGHKGAKLKEKTEKTSAAEKDSEKAAKPTNSVKPSGNKPKPPDPALLKLLHEIKDQAQSLALRSVVEETIYQHQFRREIGTALCLRVVVELATLDHINRKLPTQYAKVSEKAIKSLLNYMNSNPDDFFDKKADYAVAKCVQGLAAGSQADVVLLNNIAHGHYQPNFQELNRFATNLEPLMRWAISS